MIRALKGFASNAVSAKRSAVVFPWERRGQTLVVRPRGDLCGFSRVDIQMEMNALQAEVSSPEVTALVFDLSEANYFGSEILRYFLLLTQPIKERQGRVAVCGASRDVRFLLHVVKLDELWPLHPTLSEALRSVA